MLGQTHPLTEESRALAESVRGLVENWRRFSEWSLWLLSGGLLGALAFAWLTVAAERRGQAPSWVVALLPWGSGGAFGVATALGGALLLAQHFPETGAAGQVGKLGYAIGQFGGLVLAGGIANLLRRRAGLPRKALLTVAVSTKGPIDPPLGAGHAGFARVDSQEVRRAIRRGLLALYLVPNAVFLLPFLPLAVFVFWFVPPGGDPPVWSLEFFLLAGCFLSTFVLAICLGTLAWAMIAPHWRVWAMAQVRDLDLLEAEAVRWLFLPNRASAFGRYHIRQERWTPALRERARLLRAGRGHPSWSGDG